ncbi:MAG: hypothetical protein WDN69_31035 [Aliidongia sp.]
MGDQLVDRGVVMVDQPDRHPGRRCDAAHRDAVMAVFAQAFQRGVDQALAPNLGLFPPVFWIRPRHRMLQITA